MSLFSERLKKLREEKGISQEELSVILGYKNKSSITALENDRQEPSIKVLEKIADYFKVSVDYLIGRTLLSFDSSEASEWFEYRDADGNKVDPKQFKSEDEVFFEETVISLGVVLLNLDQLSIREIHELIKYINEYEFTFMDESTKKKVSVIKHKFLIREFLNNYLKHAHVTDEYLLLHPEEFINKR